MDFLSTMSSQVGDSQMVSSQYSSIFGNGTQEDFSFQALDSQSQFNSTIKQTIQPSNNNNNDFSLEIIHEEEGNDSTPYKSIPHYKDKQSIANQQQQQTTSFPFHEYKMQQLSQQIDHIETETKMSQQSVKHLQPKNQNGNVPLNAPTITNPSKSKELSQMSSHFIQSIDNMLNQTEKIMDNYKNEYCFFIDEHKTKFRKNVEFLKQLLVAETEFVLNEEEKNKVLDNRMQTLFNEMMNILNDYQS